MVSAIDPTKPTSGNASTESVRDNFQVAKDEIEVLQSVSGTALQPVDIGTYVDTDELCVCGTDK